MTLDVMIKEIEARAQNATGGPWRLFEGDCILSQIPSPDEPDAYLPIGFCTCGNEGLAEKENASFIAAARTDVPRLCRALRIAMQYLGVMDCGQGLADQYISKIQQALRGEGE